MFVCTITLVIETKSHASSKTRRLNFGSMQWITVSDLPILSNFDTTYIHLFACIACVDIRLHWLDLDGTCFSPCTKS